MNDLSKILADATAAIAPEYFRLPIFDDDAVYRERVYCYELYHQMRSRWPAPEIQPLRLTGEVDKRGHGALYALGVEAEKPDLLVHRPGYAENHAVIEVKHSLTSAAGIRKDLIALRLFKNAVQYDRAIHLVYGDGANEAFSERIRAEATALGDCSGIEVWLHQEILHPAVHATTL